MNSRITLRKVFAQFYVKGLLKTSKIWEHPFAGRIEDNIYEVSMLLEEQQNAAMRQGPDALVGLTHAFLDDIGALEAQASAERELGVLSFLRMDAASFAMQVVNQLGMFQFTHDLVLRSVRGDAVADGIYMARLREMEKVEHEFVKTNLALVQLRWCIQCFRYSRIRSTLAMIGASILSYSFPLAVSALATEEGRWGAAEMLAWAVAFDHPAGRYMAEQLENAFNLSTSRELKKHLAIAFASKSGALTSLRPSEWARLVLAEYGQSLDPAQALHLIVVRAGGDIAKALKSRGAVLRNIRRLRRMEQEVYPQSQSSILMYNRGRMFENIRQYVGVLLSHGYVAAVSQVLSEWNGVRVDSELKAERLIVSPGFAEGAHWAIDGKVLTKGSEGPAALRNLVMATNAALSTKIVVTGDLDFQLEEPERLGIPSRMHVPAFLSQLRRFYRPEALKEYQRMLEGIQSMVMTPPLQSPLQGLMISSLGRTWPLTCSFREPLRDRHLRRVLIWPADSYTALAEAAAIAEVLGRKKVVVDVVSEGELSREKFLSMYASDDFDVLWVISHGEFEHMNPHRSFFRVTPRDQMYMDEVLSVRIPTSGRRLLVLNFCDGGIAATLGATQILGLATSIASPSQAVVSHLWPIDSFVASVFGALLAINLSTVGNFFESYQSAVRTLTAGREEIESQLTVNLAEGAELLRAFRNRPEDFRSLLAWGSAVFLE